MKYVRRAAVAAVILLILAAVAWWAASAYLASGKAASLVAGRLERDACLRCHLYRSYLERYLT